MLGHIAALRTGNAAAKVAAARALKELAGTEVKADETAEHAANRVAITEAGGIAPLVELVRSGSASAKEEAAGLSELYRKTHPDAFWTDFGDFTWFRMSELKAVRFIGGFARAGDVKPADYLAADVDPIMAFSKPVCGHMNDDHGSSTVAMIEHYVGLDQIEKADLVTHDIGNMVGYAFAAQFPQRVTRFVIMDAPLPGIGPWDEIVRSRALWPRRSG